MILTRRRAPLLLIMTVALTMSHIVLTAPSSEAACGGVSAPRVRYHCNTVNPSTAYTNNSTSGKRYNEMYEGGSLPVGIYLQSGSSKFHIINANGYAYKTFPRSTARAYCWNRSSSSVSSARCDYVVE